MANYSHKYGYSASLYYPMSISVIDAVCPQAILAMSVTLSGADPGFHWVGAADPGGAVLALEGAPLIDQN